MKRVASIGVLALLAGCVTMQPQEVEYKLLSSFDAEFAKTQIAQGDGEINGTAFLRQQGGGVVTCAGQDVHMTPVTQYASDRLFRIYGTAPAVGHTVGSDIREALRVRIKFVPDFPEYKEYSRATKCDAQGEFRFENVKDGDYYISTPVVWQVGAHQGGFLATRVKVENGKTPRVIMTR